MFEHKVGPPVPLSAASSFAERGPFAPFVLDPGFCDVFLRILVSFKRRVPKITVCEKSHLIEREI